MERKDRDLRKQSGWKEQEEERLREEEKGRTRKEKIKKYCVMVCFVLKYFKIFEKESKKGERLNRDKKQWSTNLTSSHFA